MYPSWYEMSLVAEEQRKDRMSEAQELRQLPRRPLKVLGITPVFVYSGMLSRLGEALEAWGCWLQTRSAALSARC